LAKVWCGRNTEEKWQLRRISCKKNIFGEGIIERVI